MREIILDTETTGLSPSEGHRLVEIGCLEIVNQIATGAVYHVLINPERDVPDDAYRIHGHSTAFLADKPVFAKIAPEFLAFIGLDRLVIHNAEFDMRFINAELAKIGQDPIPSARVLDTLALARRKHPGAPNSLDALCDRYRIDRSRRVKHGALLDAEILVEVYGELLGGRQRSLVFSANERTTRSQGQGAPIAERKFRPSPLPALLTEAESLAHADHITTLGESAIWRRYEESPIDKPAPETALSARRLST
jgi:DNA polymerase III subunit epsilon